MKKIVAFGDVDPASKQTKGRQRIHNHHNFAWWEQHGGERMLVIRRARTSSLIGRQGAVDLRVSHELAHDRRGGNYFAHF